MRTTSQTIIAAASRLRNSADVSVYRNRIGSNAGAGIEAYVAKLETMKDSALRDFKLDPYRAVTTFAAAWNAIAENGVGVTLDGANAASFTGNTFINQSPKLYGGDLKSLRVRMLGFAARRRAGAGHRPMSAARRGREQCCTAQRASCPTSASRCR